MKSSNISTKVSDDMLDLQRKRIAENLPRVDKLLTDIENGATWKALAMARQEGLVNLVGTYKDLSLAIHDILCHKSPFSACPDLLCKTNNVQINAGIGLIARSSELEPKEEKKS